MTSNPAVGTFAANPGLRQFAKFCIVGASSFAIDAGLLQILHYKVGLPVVAAATISFLLAICNGFYWNRRWTFRDAQGDATKQYPKFVLTNVIGWMLNLSIMTAVLLIAASLGLMHTHRSAGEIVEMIAFKKGSSSDINPLALFGAKVVATVFVTAWNFTASKLWTFK